MRLIDAPAPNLNPRSPRDALASGDIRVDNIQAFAKLDEAFHFDRAATTRALESYTAETGRTRINVIEGSDFFFRHLLGEAFVGGKADGAENLHIFVAGKGTYSVKFDAQEVEVSSGHVGDPTGLIRIDALTLAQVARFQMMMDSVDLAEVEASLADGVGRELGDHQLALVAGGKGSDPTCPQEADTVIHVYGHREGEEGGCGINYWAGDHGCNSDYCLILAGGTGAVDQGLCVANFCGQDVCTILGCAIQGCGQDLCGGDVCYTDACGANSCTLDSCLVNGCAWDLTFIDGCVANYCVIDLIPFIPFI